MDDSETVIGITACSKSKVGGPDSAIENIKARHLYDSWLFDSRVAALKAHADEWCIFSGKYGFLDPDERVSWYDQRLDDLPVEEQRDLAEDVAENVEAKGADVVLILMGRTYADPLKQALSDDVDVWDPLDGVQLFDQRSKLDELARSETTDEQMTFDAV